jgi:hypothetical protein
VLVPLPYRPRLSVDLDAPLTTVGQIVPNRIGPPGGYPGIGQFVAHDQHADGVFPAFKWYEAPGIQTTNGVRVVPVASDPARGWWVTRIEAAQ